MTEAEATLGRVRRKGAKWLSYAGSVFAALILLLGYLLPVNSILPGVFAFGFAGAMVCGARFDSPFGRQLIGLGCVGLAMAFVAAWAGTGWVVDAHFAFLALLALLIVLYDVKVILLATVAIVLHHLGFGILFPALVFPSVDILENIMRAVFHAVNVVVLDVAIIASILTRIRMERESAAAYQKITEQIGLAERAHAETEAALSMAEEKQAANAAAEKRATDLVATLKQAEREKEAADLAAQEEATRREAERVNHLEDQMRVVETLRGGIARLAARDLSEPIEAVLPQAYESLRSDYNVALGILAESLAALSEQTADLRGQVATINSSAADVSNRSEQQVFALEQTSGLMRELQDSVNEAAENAKRTADSAHEVQKGAQSGREVVSNAVEAMSEIQESAAEIAKINALIDGIAFQTNLLALNAGVEAARAGEAGRGFAVVASEVRTLSQRTTEAANDIGSLVERSQKQVQNGAGLVKQAGEQLETIVEDVSKMTRSIETIAAKSQEQTSSFEQVTEAIKKLDGVAQGNAAMFEETTAACRYLNDGMDKMLTEISSFSTQSHGTSSEMEKGQRVS